MCTAGVRCGGSGVGGAAHRDGGVRDPEAVAGVPQAARKEHVGGGDEPLAAHVAWGEGRRDEHQHGVRLGLVFKGMGWRGSCRSRRMRLLSTKG